MGGIKNRDEKRKAAKVFSSGGGGGTKGPAVLDKRNQELPCPHCERTFKQPGRLQDHIRKQHAQEDAEGGGSDPAPAVSSAALPAAAGIAAGPAAAASTKGAAQRMILHSLGAAPQPAGQPRGAAGDGGRAGPSGPAGGGAAAGSRAPTPAPSSAGAPAGSTAGAAGGMMDVGSRGGFYSSKSPKLLLHEMCLKEKVKPRYKATQAADGLWKCKVVIPHPKNSDKDVVVFLDDSHAAPSQEEAAQRAAVAALNRVAGDRALERVLPREFVPLWNQLGMERKEREERRAKQAARQASQAARQKAAASRRQTPATVIMTEEKRRLVEGLISGLSLAEAPGQAVAAPGSYAVGGSASSLTGGETLASSEEGMGGGFSSGWDDYESDSEALSEALPETRLGGGEGATGSLGSGQGDALPAAAQALLDELLLLGFSEGHARRALAACYGTGGGGGSSGSSGQGLSLPAALDWLSLNVAEEELPAHFAPGAAGKPVSVLRRAGASSASLATSASAGALADADGAVGADGVDLSDPAVAELRQFGYPPAKCAAALREGAGDVPAALGLLFRQLAGEPAQPGDSPPDLQEWQEERTALEAIYDSDVTFHSPSWTTLRLAVPCDGTAASADGTAAAGTAVLHLECWAPASGAYPQQLPTLAVRCADVPPEALLSLTHQLALRAVELRGHPMLFELASAVTELLPLCIADPPLLPPGFLAGAAVDGSSIGGTAPVPATGDGAWDAGSASSLGSSQRGSMCDLAAAEHAQQAQQARQGGGADFGREPQRLYQPLPAGAAGTTGRPAKPPRSSRTGAASSRQRPQPGPGWEAAECQRLQEHQAQLGRAPAHAAMRAVRSRLPAAVQRGEVVGLLASRQVLVISGATGCGKSTQVPQFVLEEAIAGGQGARCNIVCTQPRRISAVGLAGRVAAERGERVGEVVGYAVRLDSKQSQRTRLLFCTTGILLRRLLADPTLTGTTHVVLDEVHERSIESDLLLLLLRNLLVTGANPGLRVILMSATADAELFASYFQQRLGQPCGMVSIPGFTHPVTDYYLEDALEATGFEVGKNSKWAKKQGGKEKDAAGAGKKGGGGGALSGSLEGYSDQTRNSLQNLEEAQVNYDLVEALVRHVVEARQAQHAQQGAAAAILIFAPGAEEINRVCRALQGSPRLWVLPLHGGLPPAQQARVFDRPPRGTVKVVVATNVAETSITIDDVTCVIDCGRVKEMRFDPERGIARLQETWVSQASAQQRRGRAGRVQPGVCYRLLSRATWGRLQKDTPPEVLRAPLQGLVLDVKGILGAEADVGSVLAQMITPPAAATLQQALGSLQQIGALGAPPALPLTPLGCHLTRMPCDPRIAKMLVFGALLRCLDPVLTIAAAQGYGRPVFFSPPDRRAEADAAKRSLVAHIAGSKSDHLAVVAAYNGWAAAVERGGRGAGQDFCSKHFVADQAMEGIDAGRRQYAEILADLGFVPAGYAALAGRAGAAARSAQQGGAEVDQYSGNARVVKAALCAGFYPQLLRVDHPAAKFAKVLGGAVETAADPVKLKFFDRYKGRVFLHPSSLNFTCGKFESGWAVYSEVVQTSKVFVRESSMVPIYAILLFGGEISVSHEAGLVQVDGWATFKAPARIAVLVRELRSQCAALLAQKIADPGLDVSGSRVVEAMHHLLATDGF